MAWNIPNLEPSKELSYVLGVLDGDSWIYTYTPNYQYRMGLSATKEEFTDSFKTALESINLHPCKYFKYPKNGRKQWGIEASSKVFVDWLENSNLEQREVLKSYPSDYLRGLYESDGTLHQGSKNYFRIRIYNESREILEKAQALLWKIGIYSKINVLSKREDRPENKPLFDLNIYKKKTVIQFLNLVKPCIKGGKLCLFG